MVASLVEEISAVLIIRCRQSAASNGRSMLRCRNGVRRMTAEIGVEVVITVLYYSKKYFSRDGAR